MNDIPPEVVEELTGGGECHRHYHPTITTHTNVEQLQSVHKIVEIDADYDVQTNDDIVLCDTTGGPVLVTLPASKGQREYTIVKAAPVNDLTVQFQAGENCFGQITFTMLSLGEVRRFKAYADNWILI